MKDFVKLNKETYNKIAKLFAETRKYLWDDLKPLSKYAKDNFKILDLGCGSGRLYHLFEEFQGVDYVGVDQSEGQIEIAKEKFPELDFQVAEMKELPFTDNEFDIIYCIATFHHLPDEASRIKSLNEMKRVLKTGGQIIMTNWNLNSKTTKKMVEKRKFKKDGQDVMVPWLNSDGEVLGERYYYAFSVEELEDLFKKTDLQLEDQYYTKKGERGGIDSPGNIVSILTSP
jgi:ubiquinone/menaquinone biosynthesis C-methylase UbiE